MLISIPQVLGPAQVAEARAALEGADWVDGRVTAGAQSALAKNNLQVPEDHPVARELGGAILAANDSDILRENRATYSYCWPRDGAIVAVPATWANEVSAISRVSADLYRLPSFSAETVVISSGSVSQ